jgi:cysteine desulfurase
MEIMSQMGSNITLSPLEHPAIYMAAEKYFKKINYIDATLGKSNLLNLNYNGVYELVSCVHMQNEIGTIQPIKDIKCKFIMSDMSQSLGKEPVDVGKLGVDLAVFGAHKFGGCPGVGMMYLKDSSIWREFGTGSRYFMDQSGTPNVAGIVASVDGLEHSIKSILGRRAKMREFKNIIEPELERMKFSIIAKESIRCPNTTFCKTPKPGDAIRILKELGDRGIYCGLGSACGSLHTNGSPLMTRLGIPSDGMDYLRISQYGEYGVIDAKQFITVLKKIL